MTNLAPQALMALDVIRGKPAKGIPIWIINPMEHAIIDRLAGKPEGSYVKDPEPVYLSMLRNAGACFLDQYLATNPLSMGSKGYDPDAKRGATTGAENIVINGMAIDSPEAVCEHMEKFVFPWIGKESEKFDEDAAVRNILENERQLQEKIGPTMLKTGYAFISLPCMAYSAYGYANYFMAYALYPEVIERHFSLQADFALKKNRAAARAYAEGGLPPLYRLDHDMADSRGTLVDIRSLDKIWFPHFARCLEPMLKTDAKMIWHCDGNLMQMVPRLLDAGVRGFQGFQYETGMDYEKICRMKTREGEGLFIIGGVSVTTTLPHGTPEDVRREMKWLVEQGPRTGLTLGASSSIAPGVPWENMKALVEGFHYYRKHGRG